MMSYSLFGMCIAATAYLASAYESEGNEVLERGPGRILFIGHPMIDIYCKADQSVIDELGFRKGESNRITPDVFKKLGERVKIESQNAGGSSACTARSYSFLGGYSTFFGLCGDDKLCDDYAQCLSDYGVNLMLKRQPGQFTTQLYSLVTPDAERSMYFLGGASHGLNMDSLPGSIMDDYDFFGVNGYTFATPQMVDFMHNMIEETLKRGKRVLTMLANAICIRRNGKYLKPIAEKSAYITGNLEEYLLLYELEDREEVLRMFEQRTSGPNPQHTAVIITMGGDGAYIVYQGRRHHVKAPKVEVVDTTGAGDFFCGGVFYGLFNGYTVRQAGIFGAAMAGEIINHFGTLVRDDFPAKIEALKKQFAEEN
uniref:Adenosine kinase n=1 Tax=Babesia canis TaxID=5867 RepID=O44015_BABCA|nr:adenosine kinase [Babesia canis rossi]